MNINTQAWWCHNKRQNTSMMVAHKALKRKHDCINITMKTATDTTIALSDRSAEECDIQQIQNHSLFVEYNYVK